MEYTNTDVQLTQEDLDFELYEDDILGMVSDTEHQEGLEGLVSRCLDNGLPVEYEDKMRALVNEFSDVFRVKLCDDPPAKVTPWMVY